MRVGLIGFGKWGPNLARNIAKHATLAWVADDSAEARQRILDAGYPVTDGKGAFNNGALPVDAIVIATPIRTHGNLVEAALARGKHVLCEKPLTTHAGLCMALASEARHYGLTLMMSAPWLYHPAIQRAGQVATELGAPLWFRAARTSWDERDLDPIADLLPHDVGILRAWTGQRVAEVSAVREGPTASVTLRTTGGVLGPIQYTYRDRGKVRRVEMGCSGGSVAFDGATLTALRADAAELTIDYGALQSEPLDAMCAEFVDCCKTGRTPRHGNADDALHVAEVIEAAHKSVSERGVVGL